DIATFTDVGFGAGETFSFSMDWGDGTDPDTGQADVDAPGSPGVPTAGSVDGVHTYIDDGTFVVTITITDDDGGQDAASMTVTVSNVAPLLHDLTGPDTVQPGQMGDFSALLSDNAADILRCRIDYGDGVNVPVRLVPGGSSNGMQEYGFDARHLFTAAGPRDVTVTVTDDDGTSASQALSLAVPFPAVAGFERNGGTGRLGDLTSFALAFTADVSGSLQPDDLAIWNITDDRPIAITAGVTVSWNPATYAAEWDFSELNLLASRYRVSLADATTNDRYGNLVDGDGDGAGGGVYEQTLLVAYLGDANGDGQVGIADLSALADNYGIIVGAAWRGGDFNADGVVGIADLSALADNYGRIIGGRTMSPADTGGRAWPEAKLPRQLTATVESPGVPHGMALATCRGLVVGLALPALSLEDAAIVPATVHPVDPVMGNAAAVAWPEGPYLAVWSSHGDVQASPADPDDYTDLVVGTHLAVLPAPADIVTTGIGLLWSGCGT
ncbi:MAG: PKD domain-containing protein, partial [Planctomycetota bacterium]